MRKSQLMILGLSLFIFLAGCFRDAASESKVPRMTKEELRSMIGDPDLVVLDVRASRDWNQSDWKIKGALRENPGRDLKTWANRYSKEKKIVFY